MHKTERNNLIKLRFMVSTTMLKTNIHKLNVQQSRIPGGVQRVAPMAGMKCQMLMDCVLQNVRIS